MANTDFARILSNSGWLILVKLARLGVNVLITAQVARYLGPEQYGIINYCGSITAVFSTVTGLAFDGVILNRIIQNPADEHTILRSAAVVRVFAGICAAALAICTSILLQVTPQQFSIICILALCYFSAGLEVFDLWFQRRLIVKSTVKSRFAALGLTALLRILLVSSHATLPFFAAAIVFESLASGTLIITKYQTKTGMLFTRLFSVKTCKQLILSSLPMALSGALVMIYLKCEQFLVMKKLGPAEFGTYFAACSLSEVWRLIPAMVLTSIFPKLVEKSQSSSEDYQKYLQQTYDGMFLVGVAVAIVGILIGPIIIPLVFGERFSSAVIIFQIAVCASPFAYIGAVRSQQMMIESTSRYNLMSAVIGIAVNFSATLILIFYMGSAGAALASLLGFFISTYLTSWMFPALRKAAILQTKSFSAPCRFRSLAGTLIESSRR